MLSGAPTVKGPVPMCLCGAHRVVPTAVLSRQTAGLRGKALILNLPGKPRAIRETIDEVRTSRFSNLVQSMPQAWVKA